MAYLDSLAGFRGIKFGTGFTEFKDLALDQDHGKLKLYTKTNEDLKLGLARLDTIVYHFFDDKFYGVSIHTNDPAVTRRSSLLPEPALAKEPGSINRIPFGRAKRPGLSSPKIRAPAKERYSLAIAN